MVALRKELTDVVYAIGNPPPFAIDATSGDDPVAEFNALVRAYRKHMMGWRASILDAVVGLENALRDARDTSDDALRDALSEIMPPVNEVLSASLERAKRNAVVPPAAQRDMALAVLMDPRLAPIAEETTRTFKLAAEAYVDALEDVRDRVHILEWDFDPDARGGEVFTSADDLLASLDR